MHATFEGSCAPPGSRGGCYRIVLQSNGSFRQWLLDGITAGSYTIQGNRLTLTSGGGPPPEVHTTTDRFRTLSGGYRLVPNEE